MSIEAFFEAYPVLIVAPFSSVMFMSARQDRAPDGTVSPFNYALWLGALLPLGWACGSADRPWQLAGMVAILATYAACALRTFLPRPHDETTEPKAERDSD